MIWLWSNENIDIGCFISPFGISIWAYYEPFEMDVYYKPLEMGINSERQKQKWVDYGEKHVAEDLPAY